MKKWKREKEKLKRIARDRKKRKGIWKRKN